MGLEAMDLTRHQTHILGSLAPRAEMLNSRCGLND